MNISVCFFLFFNYSSAQNIVCFCLCTCVFAYNFHVGKRRISIDIYSIQFIINNSIIAINNSIIIDLMFLNNFTNEFHLNVITR